MTFRFVVDCFEFTDVIVFKRAHMIILFFLMQVTSVEKKRFCSQNQMLSLWILIPFVGLSK